MKQIIPEFLLTSNHQFLTGHENSKVKLSIIDRGIKEFADIIKTTFMQWETSTRNGLLQRIDPRVKLIFMTSMLIIISLKKTVLPELAISGFILSLALLSRLGLFDFYKRILFLTFIFGFMISFPASLNLITPGEVVLPLMQLDSEYNFWIYSIPKVIGFSREGIESMALLTLRVFNSISISFLVMHTTQFFEIIKSLSLFRVPGSLTMIITLSYKYIFIFAKTVEDMYLAMKSRIAGRMRGGEMRAILAGRIAFIFRKSWSNYETIYRAMIARGFTGDVSLSAFRRFDAADYSFMAIFTICAAFLIWI